MTRPWPETVGFWNAINEHAGDCPALAYKNQDRLREVLEHLARVAYEHGVREGQEAAEPLLRAAYRYAEATAAYERIELGKHKDQSLEPFKEKREEAFQEYLRFREEMK